jgi:hypothetical protein
MRGWTGSGGRREVGSVRMARTAVGIVLLLNLAAPASLAGKIRFHKLAETGQPMPDGGGELFQEFYGPPAIDGEHIVFQGYGGSREAIYSIVWPGFPTTVVDTDDAIPGAGSGDSFLGVNAPAVRGDRVVFTGHGPSGSSGPPAGVYGRTASGPIERHAAVGDLAPGGSPGATFASLTTSTAPIPTPTGNVALWGRDSDGRSGIFTSTPTGLLRLIDDTHPPFVAWDVNRVDLPAVGVGVLVVRWTSATGCDYEVGFCPMGLVRLDSGGMTPIVDTDTVPPGASYPFNLVRDPLVQDDTIVFRGASRDDALLTDNWGIYTSRNGTLELVVDRHTELPAATPSDGWLVHTPAVDAGNIAFSASKNLPTAESGVFLVRDGVLEKVIDSSSPFDGKTVQSFDVGPFALSGDYLVFRVGFTDRSRAVYLADLDPPPPVPAMGGAAVTLTALAILALAGLVFRRFPEQSR